MLYAYAKNEFFIDRAGGGGGGSLDISENNTFLIDAFLNYVEPLIFHS